MSHRAYAVVIKNNNGRRTERFFNSIDSALRYRGKLKINDFEKSGIYRLRDRGQPVFLYGHRVGYPS